VTYRMRLHWQTCKECGSDMQGRIECPCAATRLEPKPETKGTEAVTRQEE
jgi:hypothetical protein